MNLRSVTRGDAALAASALLLLVSSFFTFFQASSDSCNGVRSSCSTSAWSSALFPLLPAVVLLGVIGPVLVLLARLLPQEPVALGIGLRPWGVVLTVASAWSALWTLFGGPSGEIFGVPAANSSPQLGAFLAFLFCAASVVLAVAGPVLPVLAAPLLPEATAPAAPSPYGVPGAEGQQGFQGFGAPAAPGAPGAAGAPVAPGTPGAPQPHVGHFSPQPVQQAHPGQPFHGPDQPGATLPTPAAEQPGGTRGADTATARLSRSEPQDTPPAGGSTVRLVPGAQSATPTPPPVAEPASAAFAPFWFAVPAARPLAPEHDPAGAPVGELVPGTWYLAIAQRGDALLARTQEGKSGLLVDTSGIQRG
ncbi:hypothetical protein [Streptacidiphilus jiangxiensis]|uniref:Uncharacterized protein n=1 Tax=Streptacidiphilus jiangxiensis TaxID=235985 RepID=A0A1H7VY39_STRJI|nr:hypothetical protein [Streptacidiphilus jiangxiensis]SEM13769.1 hypothetical protein SAMN05414137_11960 [Streptacidiphilus jiangxiensis]